VLTGLILVTVGLGATWLAILGWRHRHEERISLIEAAILKTTGAEPLPLTKFDRALQWFQLIMMSVFGPLITLLGVAFLFGD